MTLYSNVQGAGRISKRGYMMYAYKSAIADYKDYDPITRTYGYRNAQSPPLQKTVAYSNADSDAVSLWIVDQWYDQRLTNWQKMADDIEQKMWSVPERWRR